MNREYDIVVGIDPDVDESGIAFLNPISRSISTLRLRFPNLIDKIRLEDLANKDQHQKMVVVVEASWMNKISNYHRHYGKAGDTIGKMVGRNQQVGMLIVECCKYYNIEVIEMKPLRKIWHGADGKISAEEIKDVCGLSGKHNQEERDAALLAWVYADLPLKVSTNTIF